MSETEESKKQSILKNAQGFQEHIHTKQNNQEVSLAGNEFDEIEVERLPEDVFKTVSEKLTYDWYRVAHLLSIHETELEHLKEDFSTTYEQTFQMMNTWRKANPHKVWHEMKCALIKIGRMDLVNECERKLIPRYATFGVQRPSVMFFAREKELVDMHDCLNELQVSGKSCLVLVGISGIGKTQLARRYVSVYHKCYDNIIWLDAAYGKIHASMINLCNQLGLITVDSKMIAFSIETIVTKIHNYFRKGKTLYIFDNVDDGTAQKFEMYVSNLPNSFTLVTSQYRGWSPNASKMDVSTFSPQDSLCFMKQNLKSKDDEVLKEIANKLRCLPLSLHQAVLYINNTYVSLKEYLELYQSHPLEILNEFFSKEAETKSGVATINIILHKLQINGEYLTLDILNCLSYCDGKCILKQFVNELLKYLKDNDRIQKIHAITVLINYSLIDQEFDSHSSECYMFSMHEITQLACQIFQKQKETSVKYFDIMVGFMKQELLNLKHHIEFGHHWYKHLIYMFSKNERKMSEEFSNFSSQIYFLLSSKGLFHDAVDILRKIEEVQSSIHGRNHLSVLETKHNRALCLHTMGKYDEAIKIYSEVEVKKKELLGNNHPSVLTTKNNKALCFDSMGKYDEAIQIYSEVEKLQIDTLGSNHPSTLSTKNNRALCMHNMGKYEEAAQIYSEIEKAEIEVLGNNQPLTLSIKINRAAWMMEMGKYNEAIQIFSEVENVQAEVLGCNHTSTLTTKSNRAVCMEKMGNYDEAIQIYSEVEKLETEVLGSNHPSTLETKNNRAACLQMMGKYDKAFQIFSEVENTQTDVLGSTHPSTLETKNNRAVCMNNMGKYDEAIQIYSEVEKIQIHVLGSNHSSTLRTKNNRAVCMESMGKYYEAYEIYSEIEKLEIETLGINHPSTLITKNNKAVCIQMMGKYEEAIQTFSEIEKIKNKTLGTNHPSTLLTKNNIAVCLDSIGKYDEAIQIYSEVEKIQTEVLGSNHPSTLETKNNRAACLDNMGEYDKAIQIYSEVECIQAEILGSNHPSSLSTKSNRAVCMHNMGKYEEAAQIYSEVEKVQIEVLGNNHPLTLATKNNRALCIHNMVKHDKAIQIYPEI